jgi:PleD family two-component response regulator
MEKFAPVKRSEDGQPVRYLIVDDSVFARKNLARMVETFGGQVIGEAGDGISAISEYERLSPDIVLKPEVLYEVIKYVMRDDGTNARGAGAGV